MALDTIGVNEISLVSRSAWGSLPDRLASADLLVNATPVGTKSDEMPLPADLLRSDVAVLDLVYRPSPTGLVSAARACGAPARAGAGVLLGQGWRSLETWLGRPISASVRGAMAEALRRELGAGADV